MEEKESTIENVFDSIFQKDNLSIAEIFHEATKMKRIPLWKSIFSTYQTYVKNDRLLDMLAGAFKVYSTHKSVKLVPNKELKSSIREVLMNRRSIREYSLLPITFSELSSILSMSCGITSTKMLNNGKSHNLRAYASGGALYPLEIYPAIFNVVDLEMGLYHYNVRDNRIELLIHGDIKDRVINSILYPQITRWSSLILIISAVFPRTLGKYGERGYRFVLLEAGHMAQNIYLTSTALGLGCVAIGGFIDDEINDLLGIDGVNEA